MADELTDSQIELLCEIEEHDPIALVGEKRRDFERLLRCGQRETATRSADGETRSFFQQFPTQKTRQTAQLTKVLLQTNDQFIKGGFVARQ